MLRILGRQAVRKIRLLARQEKNGQDLIEYALMAAFIATAVAATFPTTIGPTICTMLSRVSSTLATAAAQGS
jgi:Flp pilus assembly pilin Flp